MVQRFQHYIDGAFEDARETFRQRRSLDGRRVGEHARRQRGPMSTVR